MYIGAINCLLKGRESFSDSGTFKEKGHHLFRNVQGMKYFGSLNCVLKIHDTSALKCQEAWLV